MPLFAVLNVFSIFVPPYRDEWRPCCHWWGGQIMTYREGCPRKLIFKLFFPQPMKFGLLLDFSRIPTGLRTYP